MSKLFRDITASALALALFSSLGCAHKEEGKASPSEVSVTDDLRSMPEAEKVVKKPAPAESRIEAASAQTRAVVAAGAPGEGSNEEYAADVDAAMGDRDPIDDATSVEDSTAQVNSAPDNSRVNRVSDGDLSVTADQQGNSKSDIEITRKIRQNLVENRVLSVYGKNVKIITRDGRVTLRGPVRSENERTVIEDSAAHVAGASNVTSGIEIAPK